MSADHHELRHRAELRGDLESQRRYLGECTVLELIQEVERRISERHAAGMIDTVEAGEALLRLGDAQMRFTRGIAKHKGVFQPVDLERVEAASERAGFLERVRDGA